MKQKIQTEHAPKAIGPYSQAVKINNTVYFSGQIPLDPITMNLVSDDFLIQAEQVFLNLQAVVKAACGDFDAIVKLTVYLIDLAHFPIFNDVMARYFNEPYPSRTTIQVAALPKDAKIEIEAMMVL
jgi:reactive intermediate/imine deaminase